MPVTKYIWDEQNYLAEADGSDAINVVYTNEPQQYGNLISTRISGATSYHHFDALGSTRQLTNAAGTVTDAWIYDAWGNPINRIGSVGISLLWIGQVGYYFDSESGAHWVRVRPFGPAIARWTTADPAGFVDGLLRYRYARNAPVLVADPSGTVCPTRKTELVFQLPTGGNTSTDIGVQIQTPSAKDAFNPGPCGAFNWNIRWKKKTPAPAPDGSFILQHIRYIWDIVDCTGKDVTIREMKKSGIPLGNKSGGKEWEFWEAWEVAKGDVFTINTLTFGALPIDDRFASPRFSICTIGSIAIYGEYGEVIGEVPDPPLTIGAVPLAPALYASETDPMQTLTGPARLHKLGVKWNCCR
jgi:RHS repeat-associated protein